MALAVKGYQAPAGARYNEQVEELQLLIGANADGVWGSESQRKWDAYVQRNRSEQSKRRMNTAIAFAINKGERRYM